MIKLKYKSRNIMNELKHFAILGISILFFSLLATFAQAVPLSGTYTIGGASPDYATFTAAVADLNSQGVSGPVIFNVRDGTYNEAIVINQITGASLTNNIVFQSESDDSTLVILEYTTNSSNQAVVILDGADYITFKQMTIRALGTSYTCVIRVINGATDNKILNCCLTGEDLASGTGYNESIIYSTSTATLDNNNEYRHNVFTNGSHGICLLGSGTNTETGTIIADNEFVNQSGYGLRLNYEDGIQITGNTITSNRNTTWYGMYLNYCDGAIDVKYNKVWKTTAGQGYGIYLNQCKATAGGRSEFFNNFVHMRGTSGTGYGIYSNYADYIDFYFNNVNSTHTSTSYSAFRTAGGQDGSGTIRIKDNIFVNTGGGYAIYVSTTAGIDEIDYNDYYVTGSNLGYWSGAKADMAAWTAATGETHSLNLDPSFTDAVNGDLHIGNGSLEGAGIDLSSSVTDDFDREARPDPPTIGADETGSSSTPTITVVGALTPYRTSVGTPTSPQTFTVAGANLTDNLVVTAPTQFELREQGVGGYGSSVSFVPSGGSVPTKTIEVRYNPSVAGSHSGNVECTSTGATTKYVPCSGISTNCPLNSFSGTYTIDAGSPASCTNFQTIGDAISDMVDGSRSDDNTYFHGPGIDGTIYFNIANGTYIEQLTIPNISGTYDSIVFKSSSGDSTTVTLEYDCPQDGDLHNYVLRFDGAQYVTVKNITIQAIGTGTTYKNVIDFTGGTSNIKIANNRLIGKTSTSSGERMSVVASSSDFNNNDIQITNNAILNGSSGIWFQGKAFNNLESGTVISGNTITNSAWSGIHLQNQDAPVARLNYITTNSTNTTYKGIYAYYSDNGLKIQKNQIYTSTAYGYGIYLYYSDGTAGTYGETSNNMINIGAGGDVTNYGIQLNVSDYQKVYYNSVKTNSSRTINNGELNCAFKSYNTNNNQIIKDNIFWNAGAGLAIHIDIAASIEELDYNDLLTSGLYLGRWVTTSSADATIASWKAVTPGLEDENSISADPLFTSATDLHLLTGSPVIDQAIDLTEVTDDIDGDVRSTDMGADEALSCQNGVNINILPNTLDAGHTGEGDITELYTNSGAGPPSFSSGSDGWMFIDKSKVLWISAFDVSGRMETLSACSLMVKYSVESGYSGTNYVRYNNGSGFVSTTIQPVNGESNIEDVFDLYSAGVDTWSEIGALDIDFINNDGGGGDAVSFDYLWLKVTYCGAPGVTAQADGCSGTCYACDGGTIALTANGTDGNDCTAAAAYYAWFDGSNYWNGTSFGSATPIYDNSYDNISTTLSGATTYTVYVTCDAVLSCCTNSSSVTVNPATVYNSWTDQCYPTIQAAVDAIPATITEAGTIEVRNSDTYAEHVVVTGIAGTSSSNTITIMPKAGETPIIQYAYVDASDSGLVHIANDYVTFDGFEIINTGTGSYADGVSVSGASNVTISNCRVHNCEDDGIKTLSGCSNVIIEGCQIYNTDLALFITSTTVVRRCLIHDIAGDYPNGAQIHANNCEISNCLIYNTGSYAIYITDSYTGTQLINNTVVGSGASYGIVYNGGATGCASGTVIKNNIITGWNYGVLENYSETGETADYNCYYNNTTDYSASLNEGGHSVFANPQFITPGTDFHLKSADIYGALAGGNWPPDTITAGTWQNYLYSTHSPCIDAGAPCTAPIPCDASCDYLNEPYPNGCRINQGCYGGTAQASKSWGNVDSLGTYREPPARMRKGKYFDCCGEKRPYQTDE